MGRYHPDLCVLAKDLRVAGRDSPDSLHDAQRLLPSADPGALQALTLANKTREKKLNAADLVANNPPQRQFFKTSYRNKILVVGVHFKRNTYTSSFLTANHTAVPEDIDQTITRRFKLTLTQ